MFIKVELADGDHRYEYINTSWIYAIEDDGGRCKLVMASREEVLVLAESVGEFLARLGGNEPDTCR